MLLVDDFIIDDLDVGIVVVDWRIFDINFSSDDVDLTRNGLDLTTTYNHLTNE